VPLAGVWRGAGRPGVGPDAAFLARPAIAAWAAALSVP
jgi:hypothetical protein